MGKVPHPHEIQNTIIYARSHIIYEGKSYLFTSNTRTNERTNE